MYTLQILCKSLFLYSFSSDSREKEEKKKKLCKYTRTESKLLFIRYSILLKLFILVKSFIYILFCCSGSATVYCTLLKRVNKGVVNKRRNTISTSSCTHEMETFFIGWA